MCFLRSPLSAAPCTRRYLLIALSEAKLDSGLLASQAFQRRRVDGCSRCSRGGQTLTASPWLRHCVLLAERRASQQFGSDCKKRCVPINLLSLAFALRQTAANLTRPLNEDPIGGHELWTGARGDTAIAVSPNIYLAQHDRSMNCQVRIKASCHEPNYQSSPAPQRRRHDLDPLAPFGKRFPGRRPDSARLDMHVYEPSH